MATFGAGELFDAVRRGNLQELKQHLSLKGPNGSLFESKDAEGNTLLHVAAEKGEYDIVTELIKQGAKPLVFNSKGDTPLHLAALNGRKVVVKGLQTPEMCQIRGDGDRTVLHCACEGCPEMVGELVNVCKSDVMAVDNEGRTPLHIAALYGKEKAVKELITTFKCPVDCKDARGCTPLQCACQNDHLAVVKLLVKQHKASLTHVNAKGETALDVAVANGKAEMVDLLVKFGCNPNSPSQDGSTLLHTACAKGHARLATELVNKYKCDVNAEDARKMTPLHLAAQSGNAELINQLLDSKATVDCVDARGCTPLHYACHGGHTDAVRVLCRHKADKKARNCDGRSALDLAALGGHTSVMQFMVGDGCDPNEKDSTGRTCLHHACCGGQKDIVELLVHRPTAGAATEQGEAAPGKGEEEGEEEFEEVSAEIFKCPVDSVDSRGKTPLHCACEFGHTEVVRMLLGLGANMRARDQKGDTGLHMAASNGHASVIHLLVSDFGLDPNINGCDGRTALHNASITGHTHIVEVLKQCKCEILAKDDNGSTPLHLAALNNKVDVVQTLLGMGCSPDVVDSKQNTPLHYACSLGHLDTVQVLVKGGASLTAHNLEDQAPLHMAILADKKETVETLIDTHHCNPTDPCFKKKSLHLASSSGLAAILGVLVKAGCSVVEFDEEGHAPIHAAAMCDQSEVVKELVTTFKCPVNLQDSQGNSALHHACKSGHLATVKVLRSLGVDLDAFNKAGDAALHVAAFNGRTEVLMLLAKYGCNINYRSGCKKMAPIHYACDGGHIEMVRDLVNKFRCDLTVQDENGLTPLHVAVISERTEVVRELVDVFRCSLVTVDSHGCTPLRYACWGNNMEMVWILCSLEPRPASSPTMRPSADSSPSSEPTKEGTLPRPHTPLGERKIDRKALHYACEGSSLELVRELIHKYKFDVNERDAKDWVPLHMAAQSGKEEIVQELLGLITQSVDYSNSDKQTPLLLACEKGCVGAVKLLLSRGANPEWKDAYGRNGIMKAMEGHNDQVMEALVAHCGWKKVFENITDYTDEHKKKYTETLHKRKDKLTNRLSMYDKELKGTQERYKELEKEVATYKELCEHYRGKLEEYTQMNIALLEEKKRHFEDEKLHLESPIAKVRTSSSGDLKSEQDQARRMSISAKYKGLEQKFSMVDQQIKQLKFSAVRSGSKSDLSARCPNGVEGIPDVTDLLTMVVPHVQGHLSEVGLQLGLTQEAMDAIVADSSNGQQWTKLFAEWKEKGAKPYTWATILTALESPEVKCTQQAQVLRSRIVGVAVTKERASSVSMVSVDGSSVVQESPNTSTNTE